MKGEQADRLYGVVGCRIPARSRSSTVGKSPSPKSYRELVQQTCGPTRPQQRTAEQQLDSLVKTLNRRENKAATQPEETVDPIQKLRELTVTELVPAFVELVEKYSQAGISMQMDASNFMEGGREIKFEFGIGDCRTQLQGTVTTEAIAFHETRYAADFQGELLSGPMLRLRSLDVTRFRNFICERLAVLVRGALRRR